VDGIQNCDHSNERCLVALLGVAVYFLFLFVVVVDVVVVAVVDGRWMLCMTDMIALIFH